MQRRALLHETVYSCLIIFDSLFALAFRILPNMSMSGGGADSIGNAPQPQNEEFDKQSNLSATRDKPGAQNKSKMQNTGIAVDNARTGIPIVILNNNEHLGRAGAIIMFCLSRPTLLPNFEIVVAFLQPTYLVLYHAANIPDLMKKLPALSDPRPRAVFLADGFSQEEEDSVEAQVAYLDLGTEAPLVITSRPENEELAEKYAGMPKEDAIPRIIKERLDRTHLVSLPSGPEQVSTNPV